MTPTNFIPEKFEVSSVEELLFLSVAIVAVGGYAIAFIAQNALAQFAFALLGIVSGAGFWSTRSVALEKKLDQDMNTAAYQTDKLLKRSELLSQNAEQINNQTRDLEANLADLKKSQTQGSQKTNTTLKSIQTRLKEILSKTKPQESAPKQEHAPKRSWHFPKISPNCFAPLNQWLFPKPPL
jgi:hypothetical protein